MDVRGVNKASVNTARHLMAICPLCAMALIYACKKPFNPVVTSNNANYLVVEGFINTGADSTIINLSRTVIVANKTTANPESKATVTVENAQGTTYAIPETAVKGTYAVRSLNLDNTKQYRLRIKTTNGKIYLSDPVTPKVTPPIDSIGYTIGADGIDMYANTHDATNNSRYYRYTYRETWQFTAKYESPYIFSAVDTTLHERTPAQQIFRCFGTDTSAHTILYSTAALTNDVAHQVPLTAIGSTSEKIGIKYSILVRQQALTKDAFDFYTALKKNTESLGSIFDAQPSVLVGNIHNIADAAEPVIGYVGAGTTQIKRIYIIRRDLPLTFITNYPSACDIFTAVFYPSHNINIPPAPRADVYYIEEQLYPNVDGRLDNGPTNYLAIGSAKDPTTGKVLSYTFVARECADCTLRGVTKQPSFWK